MDDIQLNEIELTSINSGPLLALKADLYDIESTNTTSVKIQANTAEPTSNDFLVEKTAPESTIRTRIPSGQLILVNPLESRATNQEEDWAIRITMKQRIL